MGYLYLLTCNKSNKSYVGQTKRLIDVRIKDHFKAARYKISEGCLAINAAIRKYGNESFSWKEIMECCDDELDFWETEMIDHYDTLAPNGYNLCKGGNTPTQMSDESKVRHSQNRREYYKDENLPIHVQHLKTKYGEGYIYYRKGYKRVQFCTEMLTMEQKKQLITEYAKSPIPNNTQRGKVSYVVVDNQIQIIYPK